MAATSRIIHSLVSTLTLTKPPNITRDEPTRVIVRHEIVNKEGDQGQDMGSESAPWYVSGRCTVAERTTLESFAAQLQIDANNDGYVTVYQTDDAGNTIFNEAKLAIEHMRFEYVGGLPQVFSYVIELRKFD